MRSYTLPGTYSKGLFITVPTKVLIQVPHEVLEDMYIKFAETGTPEFFSIFAGNYYVYPTPVTGTTPTMTLRFYKGVTIFSANTDVYTTTGIKAKWHSFLVDGVSSKGMAYVNDVREVSWKSLWVADISIMTQDGEEFMKHKEQIHDATSISARPEVRL